MKSMKLITQDKYIKAYFSHIKELVNNDKDNEAKGLMRVMMKEIERDVRHAACDKIDRLNSTVHNISI